MKTLLALSILAMSLKAFPYSKSIADYKCNCATELQEELERDAKANFEHYKNALNAYIRLDNDAEFLEGTNEEEAIILIHGFIASPIEVRSVAEKLNEMGYSVYMPLLYGFGADGNAANSGKAEIWKEQIRVAVKKMSKCYKRITIGGMSLGGALATDYVLNNDTSNIASVILMSPYYDVAPIISKSLTKPIAALTESLSLNALYKVSGSVDLVEIMKRSRYYSDVMPLLAMQELFKVGNSIKTKKLEKKSDVPVFLAYSAYDQTINIEDAYQVPLKNFNKIRIYQLPESLKVPHQIAYKSSNPQLNDMLKNIGRFVLINNIKMKNK